MANNKTISVKVNPFWVIFGIFTAMIGYNIHHSIFWAIIDFMFSPIVWCYWLITHQVNITIIKHTFEFFIQ